MSRRRRGEASDDTISSDDEPFRQPAAGEGAGDGSGTETDEDGDLIETARQARASALRQRRQEPRQQPPPKRKVGTGTARGPRAQAISMKTLIDEGLMWPGEDVLSVDYKQTTTLATLTPEGRIFCHIGGQDKYFDSPSAFSIYLKRLINPARKADDGWKTVKFGNRYLEAYKLDLAMRRYPDGSVPAASAPAAAAARPRAAPRSRPRYHSEEETEAESESESEPEDEEPLYADDVDDDSEPEIKPRPSKRARGAAVVHEQPVNSRPQQPLHLPVHHDQQQQQQQQQQQHNTQQHHHHPLGHEHEHPRIIPRGTPCLAAIRAYEDALKKRLTAGTALANNGGLPRGPPFVMHAAAAAAAAPGGSSSGAASSGSERPRREVKPPHHRANALDDHQMVGCEEYGGGEVGTPGAQPFTVSVSHPALALMDFHAHLCDHEIIGMLGGTFDAATRSMRVLQAFPVRELAEGGGLIDVEMDPVDEADVRTTIRDVHNMQCVGWYHSHPTFAAMPSVIDISNQGRQQLAHRSEEGSSSAAVEPYVAAIVSPYVRSSPALQSMVAWFRVEHPSGRLPPGEEDMAASGCKPVRVEVDLDKFQAGSPSDELLRELPTSQMASVAGRYADKAHRVELDLEWRDGISCADKLQATLAARLPAAWPDTAIRPWTMQAATVALRAWDAATEESEARHAEMPAAEGDSTPGWPATSAAIQQPQQQQLAEFPTVAQPTLENGTGVEAEVIRHHQQQQQQPSQH